MGQLNDLQIKAAQPLEKEYLLADGGLGVGISDSFCENNKVSAKWGQLHLSFADEL